MEDEPTCGKGLAEHAVLPGRMGQLIAAVAEILELHMTALDLEDPSSRKEHEAYSGLAQEHRKTALQLQRIAEQMAEYQDLPMGRHDEAAMESPTAVIAFKKFVDLEQELLALLQTRLGHDRQLLIAMGSAERSRSHPSTAS